MSPVIGSAPPKRARSLIEGRRSRRRRLSSRYQGQGIYAYDLMVTDPERRARELVAGEQEISPIAAPDLVQWAPVCQTRSGKIMRRILRKIAANEHDALGDVTTLSEPGVVDELVDNRMNRAS
jgi:acetyl-CoA synthetase